MRREVPSYKTKPLPRKVQARRHHRGKSVASYFFCAFGGWFCAFWFFNIIFRASARFWGGAFFFEGITHRNGEFPLCPWVLVWAGACYWHGVGGFVFNSQSGDFGVLGLSALSEENEFIFARERENVSGTFRAIERHSVVVALHNKNPPTPCLWQAPASTQKTKRKTRPAIRRSARWRVN